MSHRPPRARSEEIFTSQDEDPKHSPKRQKRIPEIRHRSNSPVDVFLPSPHHRPTSPPPVLNNGVKHGGLLSGTPEERRRRSSLDPSSIASPTFRSPYATFQIDPVDESSAAKHPSTTF